MSGLKLKRYRQEAELTQRKLGALAGVKERRLSRIETDRTEMSAYEAKHLANALGIDPGIIAPQHFGPGVATTFK